MRERVQGSTCIMCSSGSWGLLLGFELFTELATKGSNDIAYTMNSHLLGGSVSDLHMFHFYVSATFCMYHAGPDHVNVTKFFTLSWCYFYFFNY
jgi:hypothetical protein